MITTEQLTNLIQSYIRARDAGEFEEEKDYSARMENYRAWQRANILDYDKLTHYSDAEFAHKFGEMFDYSDGSPASNSRNRGMHFKSDSSRLTVRNAFENTISYIIDPKNDRFSLLEETLDTNSPYKIPGLGIHMITTLINAKYPNVPPINATTKTFFSNIGEPLPMQLSKAQRIVSQFFSDIVNLSHGELNLDDANHICWYTKTIESGRRFMEQNFNVVFKDDTPRRPRAKSHSRPLTHEDRLAEAVARLQAIHDQAERSNL